MTLLDPHFLIDKIHFVSLSWGIQYSWKTVLDTRCIYHSLLLFLFETFSLQLTFSESTVKMPLGIYAKSPLNMINLNEIWNLTLFHWFLRGIHENLSCNSRLIPCVQTDGLRGLNRCSIWLHTYLYTCRQAAKKKVILKIKRNCFRCL
jgi:hypothetical protein